MSVSVRLPQANWNDNDGGVLMGRWNNNYPPGTVEPWAWSGSVEILKKFMENGQPVCYGQCWNFAGLVTSRETASTAGGSVVVDSDTLSFVVFMYSVGSIVVLDTH